MTALVVGVDVGLTGAVAYLTPDGELLAVDDMPTDTVRIGKNWRLRISYPRLLDLLAVPDAHVFVEIPQGRPIVFRDKSTGERQTRTPGAQGMLALGETVGAVRMACAAARAVVIDVSPGTWMRAMGVTAEKDVSRHLVVQRFPRMASLFARVKDHNRAQAALIGLYGVQRLKEGKA